MLVAPHVAQQFLASYIPLLATVNEGSAPKDLQQYCVARQRLYAQLPDWLTQQQSQLQPEFVESLQQAVTGSFVYLKKYKEGYAFQHIESGKFYLVSALTTPLDSLEEFMRIETVLLPVAGQWVCDGLLESRHSLLGKSTIKEVRDAYWLAKKQKLVIQ